MWHEIVRSVAAAQKDAQDADALVRRYLPFIKAETAKFLKRIPIEGRTLPETIDAGYDEITHRQELGAAQEEIMAFAQELGQYGLRLTDIAENCPKQERTLAACHRVLSCARENPAFLLYRKDRL